MPFLVYRSLWYASGEGRKNVRIGKPEDDRVIVTLKKATRDPKTEKIKYETLESFDVYDATPAEVKSVVVNALQKAATK